MSHSRESAGSDRPEVLQVSRARLAEVIIDEVRAFLSLPSCQRELTEYEGRYISGRILRRVCQASDISAAEGSL
jgi:hypothetical protein